MTFLVEILRSFYESLVFSFYEFFSVTEIDCDSNLLAVSCFPNNRGKARFLPRSLTEPKKALFSLEEGQNGFSDFS